MLQRLGSASTMTGQCTSNLGQLVASRECCWVTHLYRDWFILTLHWQQYRRLFSTDTQAEKGFLCLKSVLILLLAKRYFKQ